MSSDAKRRIRGRGQGPAKEKRPQTPERGGSPSLSLLVAVSAAVHLLFLAAVIYVPGLLPKPDKPVKLFSVTVTKLPPGPAGGGGREPEPVKPPPKPVKEPEIKKPEPEKEPVKIPEKPVEKQKPRPEPEKEPEKEPEPKKPAAPMGPGQGPVGGGKEGESVEGPVTLDVGVDFPFGFYLDALKNKVGRNWRAPQARPGKKPKVTVFFRIDRMGRIKDVAVEQGSGNPMVDRSALAAIYDSNPLPPLPDGFDGDRLGVHYTFVVGE